jgi:hypothetical protein
MLRRGGAAETGPPATHRIEEKDMNKRIIAIACIVPLMAASGVVSTFAFAAEQCSAWMDQGDGTSYKICVDDHGQQVCYRINNAAGSVAQKVKCS